MRKKLNFLFMACFVCTLLFLGYCTKVYASNSVDSVLELPKGSGSVMSICNQANAVSGVKILTYNSSEGTLHFNNASYAELTIEVKREFMETALKCTKESSLGKLVKNKVFNFISDQDGAISSALDYLESDTSADLAGAKEWFDPITGPISIVIGFLCLLIFLFLGLSIVTDTAYLVVTPARVIFEKDGDTKKPRFISNAAWKAKKQAEQPDCTRSIMSIFIGKRLVEILLVGLALGYLTNGNLYKTLAYFIDAYNI